MRIVNLCDLYPANIFLGTGQTMKLLRSLGPSEEWEAPDSYEMYWADTGKVEFDDEH